MLLHGAYKRSFAESAEEPDSTSGQDGDNYAWARHSPSVTADLPRASTVASGPAQDIRLDDDGNGGSESASWDHAAGAQLTSVVDSNVALDRVNSEALVSTPTGSSKAPTPKNVKRPKYTIPYRRNRNPCVACTVQSVRCEMVDRRPPCTRCCDLDQPCVLKYPGKKPVARPPLRHKMTSSTSQDRRGEVVSQLKSPTTTRVSHDQASATTCTRCRTLGIPCIPTRTPRCVECRDKHTKCSLLVRPLPKTMPPIIDPPLVDPPARGSDDSSEDTSSSSDDISDEASVTSAIKDEPFEDEDCLTSIRVFGHDGIHSRPGDPVARWPQEGPMAEQVESTTRLSNSIVSPNFLHRGSTNPRVVALINQPSFSSNPLCRQEFLDMWAKCRYVKEGLMSAREILDYFHWFSQHLAPHSKIINLNFLSRDTHEQLLMEDTMLGCSLLTISSRFMTLPHPGGRSRSTYIHSQLWRHCEDFIQHIRKYSHSDSRVLGAIESLLLLSDWLPRSAQETVDLSSEWSGELICPDLDSHTEHDTGARSPPVNWKHDVLGPLQRSERLSRRLIRAALNIARVSRIFSDEPPRASDLHVRQAGRQSRIRDLLSIYYIRISCSHGPPFLENGARQAMFGSSNVRIIEPLSDRFTCLWLELTVIMESAGVVFASPSPQMEHVLEGDYSTV